MLSDTVSTPLQNQRPTEIPALTGLRIIGAGWVALFHFQSYFHSMIDTHLPYLKMLEPLISQGYLGVPLFFILSGYIIWHNYGQGSFLNLRVFAEFIWRRFARLWPVNVVTQALAIPILWDVVHNHNYWGLPIPEWYSIIGWIKSAFMVQEIGNSVAVYQWNQPAWTLNGEMIAYFFFPLLVLLFVLFKPKKPRFHWICAVLALGLAYIAQNLIPSELPYSWLIVLLGYFISGAILHLAGQLPKKIYPVLAVMQIACPIAIVVFVYLGQGKFLSALLIAWVYSLTIDKGLLAKLFSSEILKIGGYSSYSLYMLHWIVFSYGSMLLLNNPIIQNHMLIFTISCFLVLGICSYFLWRFFETPARRSLNKTFRKLWPEATPSSRISNMENKNI